MELLPCGHVALEGTSRVCRHLLDDESGQQVRLLTGEGLRYDICCRDCDQATGLGIPLELLVACEGCVSRLVDDFGEAVTWRGEPGVGERPEPLDQTVIDVPLPVAAVDIAPVAAELGSVWLLLTADGQLGRFDAGSGDWSVLAGVSLPTQEGHEPFAGRTLRRRLHTDPYGRFAAVVDDYGLRGQVLDLRTGALTLDLAGGDYHEETVPFSLAFLEHAGRPVVVHRTGWNRLDVSDAATGELLTAREPTSYGRDEARPEHYLDYFHGALHPSPSQRWLADDGWVWSPVGMPRVWDAHRWLGHNVWESEDGPSVLRVCLRSYRWDNPMRWVGQNLLAVSGIGDDDEAMLAGVRIFDVATGIELFAFAGPTGELFADGRRLYAAAPDGLQVWDPVTGERTGTIAGFVPTHHHPGAGELAGIADGQLRRWRTVAGASDPRT